MNLKLYKQTFNVFSNRKSVKKSLKINVVKNTFISMTDAFIIVTSLKKILIKELQKIMLEKQENKTDD